jgi:hypothetical protein
LNDFPNVQKLVLDADLFIAILFLLIFLILIVFSLRKEEEVLKDDQYNYYWVEYHDRQSVVTLCFLSTGIKSEDDKVVQQL